jgi:hypothetical protein
MNGGRLHLLLERGPNRQGGLLSASLLFGEYCQLQSVEFLIVQLLDRGSQVFRRNS